MTNRLRYIVFFLFALYIASSCATYNMRVDSKREWIEGKPFPVRLRVSKLDKISRVTLNYSFNGSSRKSVAMSRNGNDFTCTIPGEEVAPGMLRYNITYDYKGKGKSLSTVSVTILTIREAKQKYTDELRSRISFSPPAQVPVTRDRRLTVTIRSPGQGTKVLYYRKAPEQASFRESELTGSNGSYTAVVSRSELQAGFNTYYFRVIEENADVGPLEVFVGGHDSANPFRYDILSLSELKQVITGEMQESIVHTTPRDVHATRDLEVALSVSYGPSTFIREFSKNSVFAEIYYRSPAAGFKRGAMTGSGDRYTFIIPSADLKSGYNSYYFKITDNIEDIGVVTVTCPASGALFSYNILSAEEILRLKTVSLSGRISHTPATETDGVSDLLLELAVENAGENTNAVLFFRQPPKGGYKSVSMIRDGKFFRGTIPPDYQQNGYTQYYFVVTEKDEEVGTVSVQFPENGKVNPIRYTVLDKNTVRAGLESDLRARITHVPVTSAADGKDLALAVSVANMKEGTQVFFHHRKPGENSYRQSALTGEGGRFVMVVPKQDVHAGYSQYYFEVREPHRYFGYIEADVPSAQKPYEFEITKLKNVILDGIDFTPLPDVEYGDPVEARIRLNNDPEGTRLSLRYRAADGGLDYSTVAMKRSETEYSAVLPPSVLQKGTRIDYYFAIAADQDEFTYPDERIIPLYFTVKQRVVEDRGSETVFGSTGRGESNTLEGRIFQLEPDTKQLPQNMHRDYKSLLVLYATKIDVPTRNFTEGFPGLANVYEWFGIQYRGSIRVKKAGLYGFRLLSDDGSKLFIDSNLVIDNDGIHAPKEKRGEIYLSPGTYPVRVDYFQGPKMQIALQLYVTQPEDEEKLFDLKDFE
jgi:hypothetical protein